MSKESNLFSKKKLNSGEFHLAKELANVESTDKLKVSLFEEIRKEIFGKFIAMKKTLRKFLAFGLISLLILLAFHYITFRCLGRIGTLSEIEADRITDSRNKSIDDFKDKGLETTQSLLDNLFFYIFGNYCRSTPSIVNYFQDNTSSRSEDSNVTTPNVQWYSGGPSGPAGLQGAAGIAGSDGDDGDDGAAGSVGPAGPAGPAALTPVAPCIGGEYLSWDGLAYNCTLTTNTFVNDGINSLTSTVNGIVDTDLIISSSTLTTDGTNLITSVNGVIDNLALSTVFSNNDGGDLTSPSGVLTIGGGVGSVLGVGTTLDLSPCGANQNYVYNGAAWVCADTLLSAQNGTSIVGNSVELGSNPLLHASDIPSGGFDLTYDGALSGGNFGIGTLSPQEKLDVVGNGLFSGNIAVGGAFGSTVNPDNFINIDVSIAPTSTTTGLRAAIDSTTNELIIGSIKNLTNSAAAGVNTGMIGDANFIANNDLDASALYGTFDQVVSGTGSISTMIGARQNVGTNTSGTVSLIAGNFAIAQTGGTGTITEGYGYQAQLNNLGTGTIESANVYNGILDNSGVMNDAALFKGFFQNNGGTITNAIDGLNISGWLSAGGATANVSRGIYIDDSISIAMNNWAFASDSSADSYFSGNLGLGLTSPTTILQVAGTGAGGNAGIQWEGVLTAPALSSMNAGRIFYNATTQGFECSLNTGAYTPCITGAITTADNGLSINPAGNVQLGGPLIQNTTITNNGFDLLFNGTGNGAGKIATFAGDIDVQGVIDPTALLFSMSGLGSYDPFTQNGYKIGITDAPNSLPIFVANTFDRTDAFQVRQSDDTTVVFDVDTQNMRAGVRTATPNSALHVNGSIALGFDQIGFNLTLDDTHQTIVAQPGSSITLPSANGIEGRIYSIKNETGALFIPATSFGETIDGVAPVAFANGDARWFISDGANWHSFAGLYSNVTNSVTAGAGITNTGTVSDPILDVLADNGLQVDPIADRVRLGGAVGSPEATNAALLFNTEVPTNGFDIGWSGSGNFGIGIASPQEKLHLISGGGGDPANVLFEGPFGAGSVPGTYTSTTRMYWSPGRSAFRAGSANGAQWDNANVGDYSTAFGLDTTASGLESMSWGATNMASGTRSTSWGELNQATGTNSTAFGSTNTASSNFTTAWGFGNVASMALATAWGQNTSSIGQGATSWGDNTDSNGLSSTAWGGANGGLNGPQATGDYSTAFGITTLASDLGATAWGNTSMATNDYATAWGTGNTATALNSTSWGFGSDATGDMSTAFGTNTQAFTPNSTAWGSGAFAMNLQATAFGEATQASGENATSFGDTTLASGATSLAFGNTTQALATNSTSWGEGSIVSMTGTNGTAFGFGSNATGSQSTAFGSSTDATGLDSTSWGSTTQALGDQATSWGDTTVAFGTYSTAFGNLSMATAEGATAWGQMSQAQANYSTTWGTGTTASMAAVNGTAWGLGSQSQAIQSTAFGDTTIASGDNSTSWGDTTVASALNSTAFGATTNASGEDSTAFGSLTQARGQYSTAFGLFSQSSATTTSATSWGTGTSVGMNAMGVDNATAFGFSTNADEDQATAFGNTTNASGVNSTAFGLNTDAISTQALAFGEETLASGINSTAFGFQSIASGQLGTTWGQLTQVSNSSISSTAFGTGSGVGITTFGVVNGLAFGQGSFAEANQATAFGMTNDASGVNSTAFGLSNDALADQATAFGQSNSVNGINATGWGFSNQASAERSTTFGNSNIVNNAAVDGTAFGGGNILDSVRATAFGFENNVGMTSLNGTAFGQSNNANGVNSTVWGQDNLVDNSMDTAWGQDNIANGSHSTTWGQSNQSQAQYATTFGTGNLVSAGSTGSTAFGISNEVNSQFGTAWGNDNIVNMGANNGTTFGTLNTVSGMQALAFGNTTQALMDNSTSFGLSSIANGLQATAFGNSTQAISDNATAFGVSTTASGAGATAFGSSTQAIGSLSTAFGDSTVASGSQATSWGDATSAAGVSSTAWGGSAGGLFGPGNVSASGDYSTAFGVNTQAMGLGSTTFGLQTNAQGDFSTAWGFQNTSTGQGSTSWGSQNYATGVGSTVWGQGNVAGVNSVPAMSSFVPDTLMQTILGSFATRNGDNGSLTYAEAVADEEQLFIIGNGNGIAMDAEERSNAFYVNWTGDMFFERELRTGQDLGTYPLGFAGNIGDVLISNGPGLAPSWNDDDITYWRNGGNTGLTAGVNNSLGSNDAIDLIFETTNTERMRLLSTGEFGIGTIAPINILDIAGGAVLGSGYAGVETAPTNGFLVEGNTAIGANTATNRLQVTDTADDTVASFTGTSGTCTVDTLGGGWSCSSDQRLKMNIASLTSGLDVLMKVRPVTYNWKSNPSGGLVDGFIAQEVEQVLPNLVGNSNNGYKTLNTGGFMPYVIKGLQEVNTKVDLLDLSKTVVEEQVEDTSIMGKISEFLDSIKLNINGAIAFIKDVIFEGSATFLGQVNFDSNQVGVVTIPANSSSVTVHFKSSFTTSPVITLTQSDGDFVTYKISNVSKSSFDIELKESVDNPVKFNFQAFVGVGPNMQVTSNSTSVDPVEVEEDEVEAFDNSLVGHETAIESAQDGSELESTADPSAPVE